MYIVRFLRFITWWIFSIEILQSLDAEQSIQWIKAERLPVFLDSDCYLEYRLSKFLSQVGASGRKLLSYLFLHIYSFRVISQPYRTINSYNTGWY